MSALPGLGPLSHLDLNLPGADKVTAGDTEPPACHLFDGGASVQAVRARREPLCVLPSLAGVALAMKPVHGNGQGLMGFLGDGAVGHGPCLEAGDDGLHRLHLLQRHPLCGIPEIQKPPEVPDGMPSFHGMLSLHFDHGGIFFEHGVIPTSGGFLEHMDGGRIVEMLVTAAAHLVMPGAVQGQVASKPQGVESLGMEPIHLSLDIL